MIFQGIGLALALRLRGPLANDLDEAYNRKRANLVVVKD
jgi:hypothetical protein